MKGFGRNLSFDKNFKQPNIRKEFKPMLPVEIHPNDIQLGQPSNILIRKENQPIFRNVYQPFIDKEKNPFIIKGKPIINKGINQEVKPLTLEKNIDYKSIIESKDLEIKDLKNELDYNYGIIEDQIKTIENLNNKLNQKNNTLNDNNKLIDSLLNKIKIKENEINLLREQINNYPNKKKTFSIDEMMTVNFISSDSKVHFAVPCVKTNIFAEIECSCIFFVISVK